MRTCRTLLIYCVSLIVCFFASIAMDLACGPETDPYDYYISFFNNNLQGEKEYKPFYFTGWQFFYTDKEPASMDDINAEEWASYLGKDVSTADVSKAMYHLSPSADSVLQNNYFKNSDKLPDSLVSNSFLKALQTKKNVVALKYYRFAKNIEKAANLHATPWEPVVVDTSTLYSAGSLALKSAVLEKDKFIQLRYYYQAQRLLHYSGYYKEASKVYDKYIAYSQTKSRVKGWALALKAGELRRIGDTVQSAYLFSQVFAQYPEKRLQAFQNYKYMHVSPTQILPLTANNSQKAVIYAMESFGNSALKMQPLEKVYDYDPQSPMVGVLLIREVNKLEEQYLTRKLLTNNKLIGSNYYTDNSDKNDLELLNQMNQLRAFCKLLATERKYPDYNIGNLAGAYIGWMQGDNAGGASFIRAMSGETLNPAMNDQKQLIQLLLSSQSIQKLNEVNEAQLLPALQWLDARTKAETKATKDSNYHFEFHDDQKFNNSASNFYEHILAPAYLKQGDTVRAALALLKSPGSLSQNSFWVTNLHSTQIVRLIRWRKTPPVAPYLNFLADKLSVLKLNYFYSLLGTAYLREHQYTKAIAAFKQADPTYLNKEIDVYNRADPFIDRVNDYPKILRYGKTKGLTKLQFAEAMNDIEQKIKTDAVNAPSYYYRYATGLYNTSHYGNAPYMISYGWSADDFGRADMYSYDADYIRTKNAEKYYLLARSLSSNEEFKAKCTFMAAKCRQKEFVRPNNYSSPNYYKAESDYMLGLRGNDYFEELRTTYKKTAIFKKAVGECSYLKDFLLTSK